MTAENTFLYILLLAVTVVEAIGIYISWPGRKKKQRIKVLSKGKKEPTWYHTECSHCGAELEFSSEHIQKSDIQIKDIDDLEDSEYIICPLCGKKTGVCYNRREICKY